MSRQTAKLGDAMPVTAAYARLGHTVATQTGRDSTWTLLCFSSTSLK
jgi:hypothetical protein